MDLTTTNGTATVTPVEATGEGGTTVETSQRASRKVYIVTGDVLEFNNASDAEKFLNTDAEAPKNFVAIKGNLVVKQSKVSLR